MVDMRKEYPSQTENRRQWQLDTIRENQWAVYRLLGDILDDTPIGARRTLSSMHKSDRDAILQENGILTSEQIELLK